MIAEYPIFDTEPGFGDGGTFTPQQPGTPNVGTPVPITTTPVVIPTPATTVTVPATPSPPVPTPRAAATTLPAPIVSGTARYAAADYARAARALMPRGRVWPDAPDGAQAMLLAGVGRTLERIDAAANAILAGSLPGSLTPMLPEWEAALGLPDPCAGDAPTIAQRLDQVRGRFVGAGGQSRQHFIDFAAALGFKITITNYAPFRVGLSSAGNPVASDDFYFAWGVTVVSTTGALPVDVLMCELNAVKPAETSLLLLN